MLLKIYAILYVAGYLVFTMMADFSFASTNTWDKIGFVWQTICYGGALSWIVIYKSCPADMKRFIFPIVVFSFLRAAVDIVVQIADLYINDKWLVFGCFLAALGVIAYQYVHDTRKNK